jgi:hypothetical protein
VRGLARSGGSENPANAVKCLLIYLPSYMLL